MSNSLRTAPLNGGEGSAVMVASGANVGWLGSFPNEGLKCLSRVFLLLHRTVAAHTNETTVKLVLENVGNH